MTASTKSQITGKVVDLIDAVMAGFPYGATRGDINEAVRAAFTFDPYVNVSLVLDREGDAVAHAPAVRRIMLAAFGADQETLDALLWGENVPEAVA
ncbi:MAG: hypothetical protein M3N43_06950 [Actinomycetota bacterium]|nr:hypothetical protein [Actinomycetota bacterium]